MKNTLIKQFKEKGLTYLDEQGYNEIEFHDNSETIELYQKMFIEFIQPMISNEEAITFNYFSYENGILSAVFSNPEMEINLEV